MAMDERDRFLYRGRKVPFRQLMQSDLLVCAVPGPFSRLRRSPWWDPGC